VAYGSHVKADIVWASVLGGRRGGHDGRWVRDRVRRKVRTKRRFGWLQLYLISSRLFDASSR
jgi:hypothetical protein